MPDARPRLAEIRERDRECDRYVEITETGRDRRYLLGLVDDLAEKLEEIEHVVKGVADYDAESQREIQKAPHADEFVFTARAYWRDRATLSEVMWVRVSGIARAALARLEG